MPTIAVGVKTILRVCLLSHPWHWGLVSCDLEKVNNDLVCMKVSVSSLHDLIIFDSYSQLLSSCWACSFKKSHDPCLCILWKCLNWIQLKPCSLWSSAFLQKLYYTNFYFIYASPILLLCRSFQKAERYKLSFLY